MLSSNIVSVSIRGKKFYLFGVQMKVLVNELVLLISTGQFYHLKFL